MAKTTSSQPPTFITAYGPKKKVAISFPASEGPHGRTKQSFKEQCDVNNIMKRFQKSGVLDFTTRYQPQYADVTALSYQRAMDTIASANSMFHELPAHVRDRFENKPQAFLEFVNNPNNRAEARELGLLKPDSEPAPAAAAAPAAQPPAAAAASPAPQKGEEVKK